MKYGSERNARRKRRLATGQAILDGVVAIPAIVQFIEWMVSILHHWM